MELGLDVPLVVFCFFCVATLKGPFILLMNLISDGPKLTVIRICADDFGSALKSLDILRRQASIFDLAAKCAGLILKPAKCVLIITVLRFLLCSSRAYGTGLRSMFPNFPT